MDRITPLWMIVDYMEHSRYKQQIHHPYSKYKFMIFHKELDLICFV